MTTLCIVEFEVVLQLPPAVIQVCIGMKINLFRGKQPEKAEPADIDMEVCERCSDQVKVTASIEDPTVIAHILKHLKQKAVLPDPLTSLFKHPSEVRHKLDPQVGLFN